MSANLLSLWTSLSTLQTMQTLWSREYVKISVHPSWHSFQVAHPLMWGTLRSGVPPCLVNSQNLQYLFTLTTDNENPFCEIGDIRQQIFLTKLHDNLMFMDVTDWVDSVSDSADSLASKSCINSPGKRKIHGVDSFTALKTWIFQDHQNIRKMNCWYELSVYQVELINFLSLYNF